MVRISEFWEPSIMLKWINARNFKFGAQIDLSMSHSWMQNTPKRDVVGVHGPNFKFWKWLALTLSLFSSFKKFCQSTDVTSTDLVSGKGKTKEVCCCDIVIFIVLFWCIWCVKDYNVVLLLLLHLYHVYKVGLNVFFRSTSVCNYRSEFYIHSFCFVLITCIRRWTFARRLICYSTLLKWAVPKHTLMHHIIETITSL